MQIIRSINDWHSVFYFMYRGDTRRVMERDRSEVDNGKDRDRD